MAAPPGTGLAPGPLPLASLSELPFIAGREGTRTRELLDRIVTSGVKIPLAAEGRVARHGRAVDHRGSWIGLPRPQFARPARTAGAEVRSLEPRALVDVVMFIVRGRVIGQPNSSCGLSASTGCCARSAGLGDYWANMLEPHAEYSIAKTLPSLRSESCSRPEGRRGVERPRIHAEWRPFRLRVPGDCLPRAQVEPDRPPRARCSTATARNSNAAATAGYGRAPDTRHCPSIHFEPA